MQSVRPSYVAAISCSILLCTLGCETNLRLTDSAAQEQLRQASIERNATTILTDGRVLLAHDIAAQPDSTHWIDLDHRPTPRAIAKSSITSWKGATDGLTSRIGLVGGREVRGIVLASDTNGILFADLDSLRQTIPTSTIRTIRLKTPMVSSGTVIGALTGLCVGGIWALATPAPAPQPGLAGAIAQPMVDVTSGAMHFLMIVSGTLAGAIIGGLIGMGHTTVFYGPKTPMPTQ